MYNTSSVNISNISLTNLCLQRKKQMAFNIPQLRLDKASPYDGTYTKQQLDMRRKAEILQYSASASSTKTNNLTRKEKWAQIARGTGQRETYEDKRYTIIDSSGTYINLVIKYPKYIVLQPSTQYLNATGTNIVNTAAYRIVGYTGYFTYTIADGALKSCAADNLIPTPTSASGIPGPIQYLIYDTNIPLYNYAINNNALGTSNTGNQEKWLVNIPNDTLILNGQNVKFASIMITDKIDQTSYTFSMQIPISFSFDADIDSKYFLETGNNSYNISEIVRVNITSVLLDVYYNQQKVNLKYDPIISISNIYENFFSIGAGLAIGNETSYTDGIKLKIFAGFITINNIFLYTEPGYVYDFNVYLSCNIEFVNRFATGVDDFMHFEENKLYTEGVLYYNKYFFNSTSGIFINPQNNDVTYVNTYINNYLPSSYTPFSITGQ